jgi:hypothetical protein
VGRLAVEGWPTFLLHGDITYWDTLFDEFAELQILLCVPANTVVAVGHTIPFVWDAVPDYPPPTMAGLMDCAVRSRRNRTTPNTFSAFAALVTTSHQRRGLSAEILRCRRSLVAPVRPILKSAYPLSTSSATSRGSERRAVVRPVAPHPLSPARYNPCSWIWNAMKAVTKT